MDAPIQNNHFTKRAIKKIEAVNYNNILYSKKGAIDVITNRPEKNAGAVALGKLRQKKNPMTKQQAREMARKRWGTKKAS